MAGGNIKSSFADAAFHGHGAISDEHELRNTPEPRAREKHRFVDTR